MRKKGAKPDRHTFAVRQRSALIALVVVGLLDFIVSTVSMRSVNATTAEQMKQMAVLQTNQIYDECGEISYNMRRLLMENQDLLMQVLNGSALDQFDARIKLTDKISYSFASNEDYQFFYYFAATDEVLGSSWLDMQNAKENGLVDVILDKISKEEVLTKDLFLWIPFQYGDEYYMLRAYCNNNVWFICYVPSHIMIQSLEEIYQGENNAVMLVAPDGSVLSGEEQEKSLHLSKELLTSGGTYYQFPFQRVQVVTESSPQLGISIAVLMTGYGGFARILMIQAAILFTVLITLLVFGITAVYTKRKIITPVQKFTRELQAFAYTGDDKRELTSSDIRELEQVNVQFRDMMHQIRRLKIDIYEQKLQRQKLEMDNMRLQLKPHFFLNSLGMVHGLLQVHRIEDAEKMCLDTIRYLRYFFRAGMEAVTVEEAIEHVRDYFEIMKLRYPDEVDLDIYVDLEARQYTVPPLVIQTLVENSFKYGKLPEQKLEVSVTVTIEKMLGKGFLCIMIGDNGKGYPEDYIRLWKEGGELSQKDGNHIGIANIRARLRYTYGEDATSKFYNSPIGGAVAEINIPLNERRE